MTTLVDASVVLTWLQDEAGADEAERHLTDAVIAAVNWSEVLQKARRAGVDPELAARLLSSFGLRAIDSTREDAERAAQMWRKGSKLSLADRFCLATGVRLRAVVATADRGWAELQVGVSVHVIR